MLGSERAWVVHGADGIDEMSTTGHTKVSECRNGSVSTFYVHPSDFGLPKAERKDFQGGDAAANAAIIRAILGGERGPRRDVVLLNAGASLFVGGKTASVRDGIAAAAQAIDSGAADRTLDAMITASNAGLADTRSREGGAAVTSTAEAPDLLAAIVAATRRSVDVRRARVTLDDIERRAAHIEPRPVRLRMR